MTNVIDGIKVFEDIQMVTRPFNAKIIFNSDQLTIYLMATRLKNALRIAIPEFPVYQVPLFGENPLGSDLRENSASGISLVKSDSKRDIALK